MGLALSIQKGYGQDDMVMLDGIDPVGPDAEVPRKGVANCQSIVLEGATRAKKC